MITAESIVEKIGNKYFPVSFKVDVNDDDVLYICVFNDDPYDDDITVAKLNMYDMYLYVIDICVLDMSNYWEVRVDDVTEEQFVLEILADISDELEEGITVLNKVNNDIEVAIGEISEIVARQITSKE